MANSDSLEGLRKEIDAIDDKLLQTLAERMAVVQRVGEYKKRNTIQPLAPKRWQQVLEDKLVKAETLHVSPELIKEIYEAIHKHALKMEEAL